MPIGTFDHRLAFNHCNHIACFICAFEYAIVAMELIEGDIENALRWARIHVKRLEHRGDCGQVRIRLVTRDIRGGHR